MSSVAEAITEGCFHCGLELPAAPVTETLEGVKRDFCCRGCAGVAGFIFESGLGSYYQKRDKLPGAKADLPGDPELLVAPPGKTGGESGEATLMVEGIHCAACVWLIERALSKAPGVRDARVNFSTHRMNVRWDPAATTLGGILKKLASLGYAAAPFDPEKAERPLAEKKNDLLVRMAVAGFSTAGAMFFAEGLYAGFFWGIEAGFRDFLQWMSLVVALPAVAYSAWPITRGAWRGLKNGAMTMDLPIALGILITFLYSAWATAAGRGDVYFDSAAMFAFLILTGRFLEASARSRVAAATTRLLDLKPRTATLIEDGQRKKMPVDSVNEGALVEVKPGGRIPLDGVVKTGTTLVDESMLTGESKPIRKNPGDAVYAGTTSTDGTVVFRVTDTGSSTRLSRITALVEDAQTRKARIQKTTDRAAAWFVPLVLIVAGLTYLYWSAYDPGNAVIYAVAVLIITCPCALALATPAAVIAGCGRAARGGVLIKGGEVLEGLTKATHVVFDKTGTITRGRMSVTDVVPTGDRDPLEAAHPVEALSEHPIGRAVAEAAAGKEAARVEGFRAVAGKGVEGRVVRNGKEERVIAGSRRFMEESGLIVPDKLLEAERELSGEGKTVVYVGSAGEESILGITAVADTPKPGAPEAVRRLQELGVRVSMLSGDNRVTARAVAEAIGIKEVTAEVLPEDKEEAVRGLKEQGAVVVMVGDGINDGPALAAADVGVAVGPGTDMAVDAADVVIMNGDPAEVARSIMLSRGVFRVIRQNLAMSVAYNLVFMPLAAFGFVVPVVAAVAMPISSLAVIGNSIRAGKIENERHEAAPAKAEAALETQGG